MQTSSTCVNKSVNVSYHSRRSPGLSWIVHTLFRFFPLGLRTRSSSAVSGGREPFGSAAALDSLSQQDMRWKSTRVISIYSRLFYSRQIEVNRSVWFCTHIQMLPNFDAPVRFVLSSFRKALEVCPWFSKELPGPAWPAILKTPLNPSLHLGRTQHRRRMLWHALHDICILYNL